MKRRPVGAGTITLFASWVFMLALGASGQVANSYISSSPAKWESNSVWSLGVRPDNTQSVFITNAVSKTVTIDSATSSGFSASMTVTNLTIDAPFGSTNTLLLSNVGAGTPLQVKDFLTVLGGAVFSASNSVLQMNNGSAPVANVDNLCDVQIDGIAVFRNSIFNGSNAYSTFLGYTHAGSLSMSNSAFTSHSLVVGGFFDGTANFVNSTSRLGYGFALGDVGGSTGSMLIQNGQFIATNTWYSPDETLLFLGDRGAGFLTISSNAVVQIGTAIIGCIGGSQGLLTVQGGNVTLGKTYLGESVEQPNTNSVTGSIIMSGGQMSMPELHIGTQTYGTGLVSVNGGTLSSALTTVAETNGASGSLTVNGGTHLITSGLYVGSPGSTGHVSVLSGALIVTNGTSTAQVVLDQSTLVLGAGKFLHDHLALINGSTFIALTNMIVAADPGSISTITISSNSVFIGSFGQQLAPASNSVVTMTNLGQLLITNNWGIGNAGTVTAGSGSASVTLAAGSHTQIIGAAILGSTVGGSGTLTAQYLSQMSAAAVQYNDGIIDGGEIDVVPDPNVPPGSVDTNILNRMVAGYMRDGALTVTNNGTATAPEMVFGLTNGTGTLNFSSGLIQCSNFIAGMSVSSTGLVRMTGGMLIATDGVVQIGPGGSGTLAMSGGAIIASKIHLGGPGASGRGIFSSGFIQVHELLCNQWDHVGGEMDGTGGSILLGASGHDSAYSLSASFSTNWGYVLVGQDSGLTGYYTNSGGVMNITNSMVIGNCANGASGTAVLSGAGMLFITNSAGNAVLDIQQGSFILAGGTLTVDILRVNSACNAGTFVPAGGVIHYRQLDLNPSQSAIGDGIPTGWKLQYGFDPLDPTVAAADPDRDGMSNLQEYLAGTNPNDAASVLKMTRISKVNSMDLQVIWSSEGGHSYLVQTNGDLSSGLFNDLFTTAIPAGMPGEGTTSYIDPGAAHNGKRFYRVRLAP